MLAKKIHNIRKYLKPISPLATFENELLEEMDKQMRNPCSAPVMSYQENIRVIYKTAKEHSHAFYTAHKKKITKTI